MTDQFFTLLKVNIFDIPYFEAKDCYKLLNKDICMLLNITKQLKLMEIEGYSIYIYSARTKVFDHHRNLHTNNIKVDLYIKKYVLKLLEISIFDF